MKHKYLWATSLVTLGLAWACGPADDTAGTGGDGDGMGGETSGDGDTTTGDGDTTTGDGDGSGGTAGDGDGLGGGGGQGGSDGGPGLTVEEACELWVAQASALNCSGDPADAEFVAECMAIADPACESEYVDVQVCQASADLECGAGFDRAALVDPADCEAEVAIELDCYLAANP
jgi:hypothetical protein